MKKIFYTLIIILLVIGIASTLYTDYLTYVPVPTLKINNIPYPVLTPVVKAGGTVKFAADFCAYRDLTSQASQWLVNRDGSIPITSVVIKPVNLHKGCLKITGEYIAPTSTPPGFYTLHSKADYVRNTQQGPYHAESYTQEFEITN